MRLRIPELLEAKGLNAYGFVKATAGDARLSETKCYRLARGEWSYLSGEVLDALCDFFEVEPGDLFERETSTKRVKR